jgi:hypothetical protein
VLDDVQRRRLLVEPAREDTLELPLRIADIDLDERSGQLLNLPGRAGLARPKPDDDVAGAKRLPWAKTEVAGKAVPLVEKTDDGDPLAHRRRARRKRGDRLRDIDRLGLGFGIG